MITHRAQTGTILICGVSTNVLMHRLSMNLGSRFAEDDY
jgi:hypothetical protein